MHMYLAVDIGGTKTLLALFDNNGQIVKNEKFETPDDYQEFLRSLGEAWHDFPHEQIVAAAVGVPGRLDHEHGVVVACGNLPWEHLPIQSDISNVLGIPVKIENDAKMAALGEANLLIHEYKKVLYITVSTGIGIGVTINGKLDPGLRTAEAGRMVIYHDGQPTQWENYSSGRAISERYHKLAHDIPVGDPIWENIASDLAPGIFNIVSIVQPDVVVIGGGVGQQLSRFHDVLVRHLKQFETKMVPIPPLRQAQHAEEAVIYGGYNLLTSHEAPVNPA